MSDGQPHSGAGSEPSVVVVPHPSDLNALQLSLTKEQLRDAALDRLVELRSQLSDVRSQLNECRRGKQEAETQVGSLSRALRVRTDGGAEYMQSVRSSDADTAAVLEQRSAELPIRSSAAPMLK